MNALVQPGRDRVWNCRPCAAVSNLPRAHRKKDDWFQVWSIGGHDGRVLCGQLSDAANKQKARVGGSFPVRDLPGRWRGWQSVCAGEPPMIGRRPGAVYGNRKRRLAALGAPGAGCPGHNAGRRCLGSWHYPARQDHRSLAITERADNRSCRRRPSPDRARVGLAPLSPFVGPQNKTK